MRALVTGATGFIGSHLAEALVRRGYRVTCITRQSSDLRWIGNLDLDFIHADLAEATSYAEKLRGFDIVFHLAGLTKSPREEDFFSVNYGCTLALLEALEEGPGIRRLVHVSSLAAAGPSEEGRPLDESSPARPVSAYGRSKLKAEEAVRSAGGRIPFTIIRPPAVYGPRDTDFLMMFKMINRGVFPYWGRCTYSMLYVADLVQGIIAAAEEKTAEGKTFFLSNHMVYTNGDIAREIGAALGRRPVRIRIPRAIFPLVGFVGQKIDKKGIINRDRIIDFSYSSWTCDPARAERELGYTAKTMLREGIKWTADWYRTHQWL